MSIHLVEIGIGWPPEPFILTKFESLAARGFRVTVFAHVSPEGRAFRPPGIEIVAIPNDASRFVTALGVTAGIVRSPRRAWRLVRAVRSPAVAPKPASIWGVMRRVRRMLPLARLRPDILHFEWETSAVQYDPIVEAWGSRTVVSCRGSGVYIYPHLGRLAHIARGLPAVFGRAEAIHCVSEATRDTAIALGADPQKTRVIRPAVDASRFRPVATDDSGAFRVISVGELRWPKGHEYALRTVGLLADAGVPVTLEIVGGDPPPITGAVSDRARLLHTAAALGIADRVSMAGNTPHAELPARIAAADVLLHLSLSEGLPNAVLEAMACGIPVVVTDVGGTGEAVRDGVDGLLVPLRDPQTAAAALERLWREPELRRRLGESARARVASDFTVERQAALWVELYREVTAA